jgi:hypothetical protein
MLTNKTTTYTLVLDNARTYIELPKVLENIKFIKITQLKYRCISPSQDEDVEPIGDVVQPQLVLLRRPLHQRIEVLLPWSRKLNHTV